jgi:hypothetical protein
LKFVLLEGATRVPELTAAEAGVIGDLRVHGRSLRRLQAQRRCSSPNGDNCAPGATTSSGSVYCRTVSTRAIVASASPDATWRGVWNDTNSEPQQLGRVLIRRVASLKGDLDAFVAQFIDGCPEGWVALDKAERCADPIGMFGGAFDGIVATCDRTVNSLCFACSCSRSRTARCARSAW